MLTKEQENILRFLLSLPRDTNNRITVSRKNYNLDYSESDFINKLRDMETLGYFEIKYLTGHHDTLKLRLFPIEILYLILWIKRIRNLKKEEI